MKHILTQLAVIASLTSPALAADHHVIIRGMSFQPGQLDAAVGDTVVFTNTDGQPHTATAITRGLDTAHARGGAFDTGLIAPGDTVEITVTRSGVIEFLCQYHPTMLGSIIAEQPSLRSRN